MNIPLFIKTFFIFLFIAPPTLVLAQQKPRPTPPACGTPDLTDAQTQELSKLTALALRLKQTTQADPSVITYVPLRPHIFRRTDGTGGMTLAKMNNAIAITNSYYLTNNTGIQFYFCGTTPDYIDDDNLFDGFASSQESIVDSRDAPNALNQYYVNKFTQAGLGGYAYFPGNSIVTTRSFILNQDDEVDLANRLVPHELGHNFGLLHTFGNSSAGSTELVTRGTGANCLTAGDLVCDTPADPYFLPGASVALQNGCPVYNGTATDAQGSAFTPSITNTMSYYFPCTHDFTPGQYDKMQAGLALRETHTAYSLDCPATVVVAPGNLAAALLNAGVVLTWQDNATNEMGYFIERSTSAASGFVAIGGVAPGVVTFTDVKTAALTTYFYRIRPSNAISAGLSSLVSITTSTCRPQYVNGCSFGDGLNGFALGTTTLSQNSGCATSSYGFTSAVSTTLTAGQSYAFSATLLSTAYPQGVTIWADLNRNGSFEAGQNELLYQTPAPQAGQVSGTLALPASLTSGQLMIRVMARYDGIPLDPCGSYAYGETEDYLLSVVNPQSMGPTDLSLSMRITDRSPDVNQPVDYWLTLANNGPGTATGVSWQNRLPPGMTFVNGDAGVVDSGTAVSGSGLALPGGTSLTVNYRLRPTQAGTYLNAAQIMSSNQPDPDSTPGSGTGDGQDDASTVDIRTAGGGGSVFSSPNPNQTPLPAVLSNQPAPDPVRADLSLAMSTSNRTAMVGRPVTFTISVTNTGGLAATSVVVRDTLRGLSIGALPAGIAVIGSGAGFTIIHGTLGTIAVSATALLIFTVTTTAGGYVRNAAQIWSAGQPDPDSVPGSATPTANNINGEDDAAWVDLRVVGL